MSERGDKVERAFKVGAAIAALWDRWRVWRTKRAERVLREAYERARGPARCLEARCDRVRDHAGPHRRGDEEWGP